MIHRLLDTWRVVRPRTIAHTHKGVENLRTEFARLRDDVSELSGTIADQHRQQTVILEEIRANLARLEIRESQLRAIVRRDAELEDRAASLPALLCDAQLRSHVEQRFASSPVVAEPFPHMVIDQILPEPLYDALLAGIPPAELFYERRPNKRQMLVPFDVAPAYGRRVWNYVSRTVLPQMVVPQIIARFQQPLLEWLHRTFPGLGDDPLRRMRMKASDGRILLRTRGYVIPPHRDPKWGFLTGLLYLARPGDSETWGTQLYAVRDDDEARGVAPYWIDRARCRQAADIAFVPNRMLVFMNSAGAHGATIPDDAEPESLERYAFQFRIGPGEEASRWVLDSLPADRRPFWSGKATDY